MKLSKLTKNSNPDKYSYSGCGIGFYSRSLFSLPNSDWGKKVIILEQTIIYQWILIIRNRFLSSRWRSITRITSYHDNSRSLIFHYILLKCALHLKHQFYLLLSMLQKYIKSKDKPQRKHHVRQKIMFRIPVPALSKMVNILKVLLVIQ